MDSYLRVELFGLNWVRIQGITPDDHRYWRIDGFGYLDYSDDGGNRRTSPFVEVWLSPLVGTPDTLDLNSKTATLHQSQVNTRLPVEFLSILRTGDIWYQNQRVLRPAYRSMELKGIDIDSIEIKETRMGAFDWECPEYDSRYLIPFNYHPHHSHFTSTYCTVIKYGDRRIIFPDWVLLQAYFSSCHYLFSQLFKFGLEFDHIYDPDRSFVDDGHACIYLKKWVRDKAAPSAARIAFNEKANYIYRSVSQRLAIDQSKGVNLSPKAGFPFNGLTTLKVRGKFIPHDFIVYEITSCSSSFPFETLEFYRGNPGGAHKGSANRADGHERQGVSRVRSALPEFDATFELTPNVDPSSDLSPLIMEDNESGTEFSNLNFISISKVYQEADEDGNVAGASVSSAEICSGNLLQAVGSGAGARVVLEKEVDKLRYLFAEQFCRLKLFKVFLERLSSDVACISELNILRVNSNPKDSVSVYSYFPKSYTNAARERTWRYFPISSSKMRSRRAIAVQFLYKRKFRVCMIEVERRMAIDSIESRRWYELDQSGTLVLVQPCQNYFQAEQLKKYFKYCAENVGVWPQDKLSDSRVISKHTLKHPLNDSVSCDDDYCLEFIKKLYSHLDKVIA